MPTLFSFCGGRDQVLHYLPCQVKFYSLSFHLVDIKRLFQRNELLYYLERCPLLNPWASQQHKYLKHGGHEPVASQKMTLGQVVPNFTGQVVSSKILRIFRWKLWVSLCSVPLSKWPWDKKKHVEISWRFQVVLLCLDWKKNFQFFVIFRPMKLFYRRLYFQRTRVLN